MVIVMSDGNSNQDVMRPSNQASKSPALASVQRNNNRLPLELLGLIFLHGEQPVYPIMYFDDDPVSCWTYPPFQVCSSWRRAALGKADLFTQFDFARVTSLSRLVLEPLKVWLQFSGDLSLDISGFINTYSNDLTYSALPELINHIHRWSSFELIGEMSTESFTSLWLALPRAYRLEYLSLMPFVWADENQYNPNEELFHTETYLPRLNTLVVHNIHSIPAIRGKGGISLELNNVNAATFASVRGVTSLSVGDITEDIIDLPASYNIRRLRILWDIHLPIIAKISALSPNTECLGFPVDITSMGEFVTFEWNHARPLRELLLICEDSGVRCDENDEVDESKCKPASISGIVDLLRKFPSIEKLVVEWDEKDPPWRIPKEFSKVLGLKELNGAWAVCPKLTEFMVTKIFFLGPSKKKEAQDLLKDRVKAGLKFIWDH